MNLLLKSLCKYSIIVYDISGQKMSGDVVYTVRNKKKKGDSHVYGLVRENNMFAQVSRKAILYTLRRTPWTNCFTMYSRGQATYYLEKCFIYASFVLAIRCVSSSLCRILVVLYLLVNSMTSSI